MPTPPPAADFAVGDIAIVPAEPGVSGAVIQVLPGSPESRYLLFLGGRTATYYASQLQRPTPPPSAMDILTLGDFQARLTALQLREPSLGNLYSLHAARVNFVPYQFRPVLKFIRSDRPRLLIADEVGVGKTIEAGLILRELQARRDIKSVLIICPKPLVTERKWQSEMKRFDEEFQHLDGAALRHCVQETELNGVWPDRYAKCILPFSLFDERMVFGDPGGGRRRTQGLYDLDPPPAFDLVIVDEAHHLRNANTFLHQGVRLFTQNAEAALFLTATPIQLQSDDLFVLLNLLRPDVLLDRETFAHMAEPNPFINGAVACARAATAEWRDNALSALQAAGETPWGRAVLRRDPDYQQVCDRLGADAPLAADERLVCIREMEALHTFGSLINRTRRRDIGNFTTRKPETVEVEFTPAQRALHDALLAAQTRILQRAHGALAVQFLMSTLRRQAASCLFGLVPLVEHILSRRLSELDLDELDSPEEIDGGPDGLGEAALGSIQGDIAHVLGLARALGDEDPKRDALLRIVAEKQELSNNKILLFSSFRHTLRYLHNHLLQAGVRVGLIHGEVPDADRSELRNRFSLPADDPQALDLLLSSEVGCEGLDYQFCDCLINYDLPWNPMRIEQRIGRIDRYGQQSETVAIYNLVTPGTVDFDIYQRCHLRIGLFRQALGGSEEILGRITRDLRSVAENLALTEGERQEQLQQIADNDIRLIQEQERLEQEQAELFGIVLPPQQAEAEVRDASSAWLRPAALQNLVQSYLSARCGGDGHVLGERALKTLRLSQEARGRLLEDFRGLPRQASPLFREWERWLKGGDYLLEITFDSAQAAQSRQATFITPIHPLAQQAARSVQHAPPFRTAFTVHTDLLPAGAYPFVIYEWKLRGVRDDAVLQPVCADPAATDLFLELLESAVPRAMPTSEFPDGPLFEALDAEHYRRWAAARSAHQARTAQSAHARAESLRVSHASRMALLREQRAQVGDERIRRMRDSQIQTAEADFARRVAAVEASAARADILSEAVAQGVMFVQRGVLVVEQAQDDGEAIRAGNPIGESGAA